MKRLPISILVLALLVALGGLGIVYGAVWQQPIALSTQVNSAAFGVEFVGSPITDNALCTATIGGVNLPNDTLTVVWDKAAPGRQCNVKNIQVRNRGDLGVTFSANLGATPPWLLVWTGNEQTGNPWTSPAPLAAGETMTLEDVFIFIDATGGGPIPAPGGANASFTWSLTATQQ